MKTTKLYQTDVYLKTWEARITSVTETETPQQTYVITLDRTAFFPEGGGQSCDLGTIGGFPVTDVQQAHGEIYHTIRVPDAPASSVSLPEAGTQVSCSLDWDRRFDNMQRHCGEHILSGVLYRMFGGVNRGFHMGQEYMTIDINLEEDPSITEITCEMALEAELRANEVIWSDAPVTVMRFDSREEAEKMPLRKALAFEQDISIVSVGSVENAADCVACCGTHPGTAGQVGLIKIYKVEHYKGMFRIYFEAGQRALRDYADKHRLLTELSGAYSSSINDLPDKLRAQQEKLASVKNELFHIKKALLDQECAKLDTLLETAGSKTVVRSFPQLSLEDIFQMGKRYMGSCEKLLLLYSEQDTSYLLVSGGTPDCGALVKEYAPFYRGKGGGNQVSARAIFSTQQDADLFADLICKHLQ